MLVYFPYRKAKNIIQTIVIISIIILEDQVRILSFIYVLTLNNLI